MRPAAFHANAILMVVEVWEGVSRSVVVDGGVGHGRPGERSGYAKS